MASKQRSVRRRVSVTGRRAVLFWPLFVCLLVLFATCRLVETNRGPSTSEAEKQSAFEQLIAKGGRLRWLSVQQPYEPPEVDERTGSSHHQHNHQRNRHDRDDHETASAPHTSTSSTSKEEPIKRHDRRHANSSTGEKKKKDHAKRQHHPGRHVCTHEETVTRPIRVVESYCKPAYKSFTQRCSNGTMCTAFKVQYDTIYRTVVKYQTTTEKRHACCPGWTHTSKHTHGCPQAVCSKGCKNGGSCVKPNVCSCPPGYTGPTCETDVDECASSASNRCQQVCLNAIGSYHCACHDGFQLQEDNRTCKFRLESVPELQALLLNYEAMSKRIAALEQQQESNRKEVTKPPQSQQVADQQEDLLEYQETIANMTQHIFALEEKLSKLENETRATLAKNSNSIETMESSNSDSLSSLSEQVAILEERLADCTCTSIGR